MAGITEAPFRGICKRLGAGLTYTEMVSAKGLHYNPDAAISRALLTFDPAETPCGVQLFGAEPALMAEQAARIVALYGDDVALIDINMGCPVTKVVSKGEGSALMRTPDLAAEIVSRVADAAGVPVTVKFRSGWDAGNVNATEFARAMEAAGAAAIAVHGRTREQFYHGRADWDVIAQVKAAVSVPVIRARWGCLWATLFCWCVPPWAQPACCARIRSCSWWSSTPGRRICSGSV